MLDATRQLAGSFPIFPGTSRATQSASRVIWFGDRFDGAGHQTIDATIDADQARSKRSRFMTLSQAATKSRTNFSLESSHP